MNMMKIEEALSEQGKCVFPVKGTSMLPLLRQERDTVVVVPLCEMAEKYDVVLFRMKENYILHRVIKIKKDRYIICGDNCISKEVVPFGSVIGVAVGFNINGNYVSVDDEEYVKYSKKQVRGRWKRILKGKAVYVAKRLFKRSHK
ncbi:MAG: hypothetical protein E7614_02045 [Ruminococcaceae bacterium]|nr:hypothetical protein [Oscillospiraceae bacterium]